jgi:hypothetical protein
MLGDVYCFNAADVFHYKNHTRRRFVFAQVGLQFCAQNRQDRPELQVGGSMLNEQGSNSHEDASDRSPRKNYIGPSFLAVGVFLLWWSQRCFALGCVSSVSSSHRRVAWLMASVVVGFAGAYMCWLGFERVGL